MTAKLTLTIDDAVIAQAKKYAKSQGTSVSDIVENYLASLTSAQSTDISISPRVRKLLGSMKMPKDIDYKNVLVKQLSKKYTP